MPQDGAEVAGDVLNRLQDLKLDDLAILDMLAEIRVVPEERVKAAD